MGESVAEGLLDQRAQRDPVPRGVNPCGFEQTTLAIHAGLLAHVFVSPGYAHVARHHRHLERVCVLPGARTLSMLFSLNLLLATFNLLPLPPLDGSAAPALVMHEDSARKLQSFAM